MELETLQGQGASPCALLSSGGAAPCGTARTPFRCIVAAAMQLIGGTMKCQGSPKATRSGLTFCYPFFTLFDIKNGENPLFYAGSRLFLVVSYKP